MIQILFQMSHDEVSEAPIRNRPVNFHRTRRIVEEVQLMHRVLHRSGREIL